jgi:hypothetical protein
LISVEKEEKQKKQREKKGVCLKMKVRINLDTTENGKQLTKGK